MMNEIIESFKIIISSNYFIILCLFIIMDIITGTLKAFKLKTVYSKINKDGITNHLTILLLVIFTSYVLTLLHLNSLIKVFQVFYIVSYGLSIVENVVQMGLPFPEYVKNKLLVLQEETNKGVISDETERIEK